MTLEEIGKLYVESHKNEMRLLKEVAELKKQIEDPRPPDHEAWRRTTYAELEAAAQKNTEGELERLRGANKQLAEAVETTEAEAQFCRRKWEEADEKRKNNAMTIRYLRDALRGATVGIRRLRRFKNVLKLFDSLREGMNHRGWKIEVGVPPEEYERATRDE